LLYPRTEDLTGSFGEPKKRLLYYLKIMQQVGLAELAQRMKISRMAVHKHLTVLQNRGLVESVEMRNGVGRPKMIYQLTSRGKTYFPKSNSAVATAALDFIEKSMGNKGVVKFFRERQSELFDRYQDRLKNLGFDREVKELAKIRDEEGYMAESKQLRKGDRHIMLEYNCPILQIAEKHWEACTAETELFEKLLGANVETTHRAANGDQVCRFMIKDKKEEYL
jgi:DeoR family suf operon transcriptional repressor